MVDKRKTSDNFRHYVDALMNGNGFFSGSFIYRYSIIAFASVHIVNALLFFFAGSMKMLAANVVMSVLLLTHCLNMIKKEHLFSAMIFTMAEIMLISTVSNVILGYDSGFQMYLIACVTASFYFPFVIKNEKRNTLSLTLSILALCMYILNYAIHLMIKPIDPVSDTWTKILFVVNVIFVFMIMTVFSYLFVWELLSKQKILALQNEQLNELANKDPLTHLLNRRCMNLKLDTALSELKKSGKRFTLVLGDIDDFKKVNDTYGHDAGDAVLVAVADTIMSNVGTGDFVCRWGGEEILILVHEPMEAAYSITEKIRKRIDENPVTHEGSEIHVSMTFGISESIPGYRIEHLIQQADDRLYCGKKSGKNVVITKLPEGFKIDDNK